MEDVDFPARSLGTGAPGNTPDIAPGRSETVSRLSPKGPICLAGTLLFLLSLVYVGKFAIENRSSLGQNLDVGPATLILAALLYALTHISSSAAWMAGLRGMGHPLRFWTGMRVSLVAQIAKYLPGNIAHYVARAGLARPLGVQLSSSGLATAVEVLATLIAAALVASLALALSPEPIAAIDAALADRVAPAVFVIGGAFLTIGGLLRWMRVPLRAVVAAAAWLVVSFLLIGLSFHAIVTAVAPVALPPMSTIGVFAVAWAAGYVVPGAPAGLGIREAILVAWLGPMVGGGAAIACAALHRFVTAIVDAIAALVGYWLLHGRKVGNVT